MRLVRFGEAGEEVPGIAVDDRTILDVSRFVREYDESFFRSDGLAHLREWLRTNRSSAPRVEPTLRLGPPMARPSKIVCIGLNFQDHARESRTEIPREPVLFFKSTTSLTGPNDDVIIPRGPRKLNWEVELAVVIGAKASYIEPEQAADHIAGYTLHNEYSEREFQLERNGQWVKGKSVDTFAPLGLVLGHTR